MANIIDEVKKEIADEKLAGEKEKIRRILNLIKEKEIRLERLAKREVEIKAEIKKLKENLEKGIYEEDKVDMAGIWGWDNGINDRTITWTGYFRNGLKIIES